MPVVHELYGEVLSKSGAHRGKFQHALCPHMYGRQCDGGGNRDMARWPAEDQPLAPFFDTSVGSHIPCGVCSIRVGDKNWAVCPRRLLSFDTDQPTQLQKNLFEKLFRLVGFSSGEKVRVWSEIALRDNAAHVNYRLDYVLVSGKKPPVIVEIMTASTSGGNKKKRTDIKNAFCDSVLYAIGNIPELRESPGVNIRQVWARMASQLIVKSQIANQWGGCTVWVVQDALMEYIKSNTGLRLNEMLSSDWRRGEINVISVNIDDPNDLRLYSGPVIGKRGEACWTELLLTPALPNIDVLDGKLSSSNSIANLIVE